MATLADRVTKTWEITAPPTFWNLLAWASVELGRSEEEVAASSSVLLIYFLREIRSGHRVVVLDGSGTEVWELTAKNMVP